MFCLMSDNWYEEPIFKWFNIFFFFGKTTKLLDKKQAVVEAVNDNMVKWLIIDNVGG